MKEIKSIFLTPPMTVLSRWSREGHGEGNVVGCAPLEEEAARSDVDFLKESVLDPAAGGDSKRY